MHVIFEWGAGVGGAGGNKRAGTFVKLLCFVFVKKLLKESVCTMEKIIWTFGMLLLSGKYSEFWL